ncbi:CPBP family intramembrane glutamic endopeptidase [Bacillus sp. AK031]
MEKREERGIDTQTIVKLVVIAALFEGFMIFLFIRYKQGQIDENPLVTVFQKEWKLLYYAFFKWKQNKTPSTGSFPLQKNTSYFWLFIALLHEQVIEMAAFHIWLRKEDPAFAYAFTGLHLYSIFYLLGDYNWVRNTPVTLADNRLKMKIGARRELNVHLKDIDRMEKAELKYDSKGGIIHPKDVFHVTAFPRIWTRIFGMSDPLQYEIVFKEPVKAKGYFGLKKKVSKALIYIDQADELIESIREKIETLDKNQTEWEEKPAGTSVRTPLINWKLYNMLLVLNLLGALALAPYAIARENYHEIMGVSKWVFTGIFTAQTLIEGSILIFIALLLGRKLKLKMPILEAISSRQKFTNWKMIGYSVVIGMLTGTAIIITSLIISKPLGIDNSSINEPSWWIGLLGSFGAGVTEETIFRLFLITFILWMILKVKKSSPGLTAKWFAILVSTLVFGAMHFGIASSTFDMTPALILAMLLINGIGGVVFGALFLFAGLEFAMLAHFLADVLIHVISPLFI